VSTVPPRTVRVEILARQDCPNRGIAISLVERVVEETGVPVRIEVVDRGIGFDPAKIPEDRFGVRGWHSGEGSRGDVRWLYYSLLAFIVVWGVVALRLTQPIILLQLGANVAGLVLTIAALHILYVNTRLLPRELRPPLWRRLALVALALFYGFFVYLWLFGGLVPNPERGFLFNIPKYLGPHNP